MVVVSTPSTVMLETSRRNGRILPCFSMVEVELSPCPKSGSLRQSSTPDTVSGPHRTCHETTPISNVESKYKTDLPTRVSFADVLPAWDMYNDLHGRRRHPLVVSLLAVAVVVVVFQEKVLICAVRRKEHHCGAEAGQRPLEPAPSREGPLVPPCFSGRPSVSGLASGAGKGEEGGVTDARSHGSYLGFPVAALRARMSKPVMLAGSFAARSILEASG